MMKKSFPSILLLLLITLQNCSDEPLINDRASVQFTLNVPENESGRMSTIVLPEESSLLLTIETSAGNHVLTRHEIKLLKAGSEYISPPLPLAEGHYKITEFILVSSSREVLYATPLEDSPLGEAVARPLPFYFDIEKNSTSNIAMEVVKMNGRKPSDFGFVSFGLKEAVPFQVSVFADQDGEMKLTPATAYILSGNDTLKHYSLQAAVNVLSVDDAEKKFTLVIVKEGYLMYSEEFTVQNLQSESEDKPLVVILYRNLIVNGDFEDAVDFYDWNSPWHGESWKEFIGLEWRDDIGKNNTGGMKVSTQLVFGQAGVYQTVPLIAGEHYQISVWVKTVDLGGPGVGVLVDNASVLDDVPSGTNDWHQYTAEFVAVDNDATIRFILRDDSIGSAYFDDVVLAMIGQ